jgi:ATP-dependent RNA helicase RhlE
MNFTDFGLDARLLHNVQRMGYETPTPIQTGALPAGLEGKDILGSAETGTGKTAAYLLPILQRFLKSTDRPRSPRALILVPTRELALQVVDHAEQLSKGSPVRVVAIYGGVSLVNQEQQLRHGVDIVVATPGRLLDHMERRNIVFTALQVLVLDEADRMLDIGFLPDIRRVVRTLPRERQTMMFSATLQPIVRLAPEMTKNPVRVEVEKKVTPDGISQALFPIPEHLKFQALQELLKDQAMDSVLVFTRTKHRADRIVRDLGRSKIKAAVIHGNRSQSQRIAALDSFKRGHARVLVATDIAARGIDVEGISHVINYDIPMQAEDYVHRIGRTGRAEASGEAYTLVTPLDERMVRQIEFVLKKKIERRKLEGLDYRQPAAQKPDAEAIRKYVEANRGRQPSQAPSKSRSRRPSRQTA